MKIFVLHLRFVICVLGVLTGLLLPPALTLGQPEDSRDSIVILTNSTLPERGHQLVTDLATVIQSILVEAGFSDRVTIYDRDNFFSFSEPVTNPPVTITVTPCDTGDCSLELTFLVMPPTTDMMMSASLQAVILHRAPLKIAYAEPPNTLEQRRQYVGELAAGLLGYATDRCTTALLYLQHLQPATHHGEAPDIPYGFLSNAFHIDYFQSRCLHRLQLYAEAITLLIDRRDMHLSDEAGWDTRALWDAAIADALAQNFEFDRALAWDDRNIMIAIAHQEASEPFTSQLLAELYLLRGQHRLYLYEWDEVMADYNAAIQIDTAPARAYYYRGLLNYTQNSRQRAYDDLATFLALEADPENPLRPLAEQYATELQTLLATPPAN